MPGRTWFSIRAVACAAAATLAGAIAASPAFAMTDIGQAAGSGATGGSCVACYFFQRTDNGVSPYTVPGPGVITRYSVRSGSSFVPTPNTVNLLTWREEGPSTWRLTGMSNPADILAVVNLYGDYPARVRVNGGERIGLKITSYGDTAASYSSGSGADTVGAVVGTPAVGETSSSYSIYPSSRVNVSAVVEPDADGDGYGDESQDLCPGDANRFDTACSGQLVGSNLQSLKNGGTSCASPTCSFLSSVVPSGNASLPNRGVIVRWRIKGALASDDFTLGAFAPSDGDNFTARQSASVLIGLSDARMIARSGPTRIPYAAGSLLAISGPVTNSFPINVTTGAGFRMRVAQPAPNDGATASAPQYVQDRELLFNADVEPDVDGDGYGDVTQDTCPARADFQAVCPPDVTAIGLSRKKFKVNKRGAVVSVGKGTTLKFTLAGPAVTRISVLRKIRRKWRKVHSFLRTLPQGVSEIPYSGRYKSRGRKRILLRGKHRFSIVATNESGSAKGLSPAFTVVK